MHAGMLFMLYVNVIILLYHITQKFDGGKLSSGVRQSFSYKSLSLNVSPMKPTINSSKFFPVKLLYCTVCSYVGISLL